MVTSKLFLNFFVEIIRDFRPTYLSGRPLFCIYTDGLNIHCTGVDSTRHTKHLSLSLPWITSELISHFSCSSQLVIEMLMYIVFRLSQKSLRIL